MVEERNGIREVSGDGYAKVCDGDPVERAVTVSFGPLITLDEVRQLIADNVRQSAGESLEHGEMALDAVDVLILFGELRRQVGTVHKFVRKNPAASVDDARIIELRTRIESGLKQAEESVIELCRLV